MRSSVINHEVRDGSGVVFFESLSSEEAKHFIRDYDRATGTVLELYEVRRTPVDHTTE
jgi:hypothetical protein